MRRFACLFFLLSFLSFLVHAEDSTVVEVGAFSKITGSDTLPSDWVEVRFRDIKGPTVYTLVDDGGIRVVKAVSQKAASGIGREIHIHAQEYPVLVWRWKAENLIEKSNFKRKSGDDYAVRIYVAFDHDGSALGFFEKILFRFLSIVYGRPIPARALNYIWAQEAPLGTMASNPYTKRVKMVVVQSGSEGLNQWHELKRNIYEDYKKAFGKEPPPVKGIGMMTDTDSTGESAVAYYGDILLMRKDSLL